MTRRRADSDGPSNAPVTTFVIFGASGDLTRRKLVPALFHLYCTQRLPDRFVIVGLSRSKFSDDEFRDRLAEGVKQFDADDWNPSDWDAFSQVIHYEPGDFKEKQDFEELQKRLRTLEDGPANRLYYLASPPAFYGMVAEQLGSLSMDEGAGWRRIVVEKPFGHDLESAKALNATLHGAFREDQIYRIDHYLGKETAQNILFFRFANTVFEPVWNRQYIHHVQISVLESVDIGQRGGYYDEAGVIRDMFQNHLLQLMALVAMEAPTSFDADAVRDEKVKLFQSIRDVKPEEVRQTTVRGQYRGYLGAKDVNPDSETPTYAAVKLFVDNWRWQGVPFFLRSGKALKEKNSSITITFDCPPHLMFQIPPGESIRPNYIALCIEPHEGIHQRFEVKVPDTITSTRSVDMEFHYGDAFGQGAIRDSYVRLLLDALKGDASLFTRSDGIERAWEIVDPIVNAWESGDGPDLEAYEPGSWGPKGANKLIRTSGHEWLMGCAEHT